MKDWKGKIPTCECSNLGMFVQMGLFLQIVPDRKKCEWRCELLHSHLPDIDHIISAKSESLGQVLIISPYGEMYDGLKIILKSLGLAFIHIPPELSYYYPGQSHTYVIYMEKVSE